MASTAQSTSCPVTATRNFALGLTVTPPETGAPPRAWPTNCLAKAIRLRIGCRAIHAGRRSLCEYQLGAVEMARETPPGSPGAGLFPSQRERRPSHGGPARRPTFPGPIAA